MVDEGFCPQALTRSGKSAHDNQPGGQTILGCTSDGKSIGGIPAMSCQYSAGNTVFTEIAQQTLAESPD